MIYGWTMVQNFTNQATVFAIDTLTAVIAAATIIYVTITYITIKRKDYFIIAFISYFLLTATISALLASTGTGASPFVALWMLLALFAPVFGIYGMGLIGAISIGNFIYLMTLGAGVDIETVVSLIVISGIPMAIGYLVWRSRAKAFEHEVNGDLSYHELANELSTVSGQSEVVIAAIADGVIAINSKGHVQLINPAAQRLIGWGKADAIGLHYKSVLKLLDNHDQAVNDTNDPIQQAISTNKEVTADNFFLTTQDAGKKFMASITISPVGTMGSGVIIVFRDTTRERAEEREQAEFISTASHEMRTPVASIEGYLGLALNPSTAQIDDKAREYITKAQDSAKHLGQLFQDLLDVSRADDGRINNKPEIIDVVAFTYDIIQGQMQKASEKGLYITFPPMPNLRNEASNTVAGGHTVSPVYYANVDNTHFREVVGNLIENAIKYTPHGGVTVDIKADNDSVTISVKDTGIGIPKEDIAHLFQKFYRVDNTATREIGGTGLGLYLSRKLIEVMGGRIWLESVYKEGSTFYVRLPRMDAIEARQQIEESADQALKEDPMPAAQPATTQTTAPLPQITVPAAPITPTPTPPSIPTPVASVATVTISPNPSQLTIHVPERQTSTLPPREGT